MSDKVQVVTHGSNLGIFSIVTIIFVLCKLFGVVNWSWWVVFSPILISLSVTLFILLMVLVLAGLIVYFGGK